jgi:hypothetical protein
LKLLAVIRFFIGISSGKTFVGMSSLEFLAVTIFLERLANKIFIGIAIGKTVVEIFHLIK